MNGAIMTNGVRAGRRRRLALALRRMMGERRALPAASIQADPVGRRLRALAGELRVDPRDADQAELIARLDTGCAIPAELAAALCAALLPVLTGAGDDA